MVELGSRCATERAQIGNSPPKVARACALLDCSSRTAFDPCPRLDGGPGDPDDQWPDGGSAIIGRTVMPQRT
jgi:hypothetical protein